MLARTVGLGIHWHRINDYKMARFRARESERPMIRASNNGLSSLINWQGGVDVVAAQFVRQSITGVIQPRAGLTPYVMFGDRPVLIIHRPTPDIGFVVWPSR